MIQPYQMIDHPIATRSPPKDHKGKRKRSKQSRKSRPKESTPRTTTPPLVSLFDNWVEPDFEVGDEVTFNSDELGVSGIGTVMSLIRVTRGKDSNEHSPIWHYEIDTIAENKPGRNGWLQASQMKHVRTRPCLPTSVQQEGEALHPLDHAGIDTCSAMSVSTEKDDFLYLDTSEEALASVELNGVGGGDSKVGGRGPMIVSVVDTEGRSVLMVDPAGVFLVRMQ